MPMVCNCFLKHCHGVPERSTFPVWPDLFGLKRRLGTFPCIMTGQYSTHLLFLNKDSRHRNLLIFYTLIQIALAIQKAPKRLR